MEASREEGLNPLSKWVGWSFQSTLFLFRD